MAACLVGLTVLSSCLHTRPEMEEGPLTLSAWAVDLPRSGQWRDGLAVADINRDGKADIVHGPLRKGRPWPIVLLGDGAGTLTPWREAHFPPRPLAYGDIAVGDLNGDGHNDIVLAGHMHGIMAMVSEGRGVFSPYSDGLAFTPPQDWHGQPPFTSRAIELADWDRDGRLDIIALAEGPGRPQAPTQLGVRIYLNRFGFWEEVRDTAADRALGSALAVADADGDGQLDIIAPPPEPGQGLVRLGTARGWSSTTEPRLAAHERLTAVTTIDRGDPVTPAIVVAVQAFASQRWSARIDILTRQEDGAYRSRTLLHHEGQVAFTALASGELDGSPGAELVAVDTEGRVSIILRPTEPSPEVAVQLPAPAWRSGCRGTALVLADLDGDRRDEIVATFAGETSPYTLRPQCVSGGGLEVWTTARNTRPEHE